MAHAYIHHIATIIHVLLYTSSILLGRLAGLSSRCLLQDLNIFLRFFTECPRISLYPFLFWSFCFFFIFCFISFPTTFSASKKKKFCFLFASFCFEAKMTAVLLLFCFVFALFHFLFASDFYVLHPCETSENTLFSHQSKKNFASVSLHFASKWKWRRTLMYIRGGDTYKPDDVNILNYITLRGPVKKI